MKILTDEFKSLRSALSLSDAEVANYFRWIKTIPFEARENGVTFSFELLPGLGEKITVNADEYEIVLREYITD